MAVALGWLVLCGALLCLAQLIAGPSTATVQGKTSADFGFADFTSSMDQDGDGVEDQRDILMNARSYIATRPVYGSRYYPTGYPSDQYGVCTDVVAQALLHAGYDLQQLVQKDILACPQAYDIQMPDPNIDFRRVVNLKVFFARQAISLTTDVQDIAQWQGGDIVIFQKHIGIVSDQRNNRGIPYIIHHSGRLQAAYEEDILESRTDLIGHYRMSE
ncbi:MAG: DUF1287 domain-containing protein [Eubacteriales bacterium]